jgi:L-arabinose transport system substrate-binding protein
MKFKQTLTASVVFAATLAAGAAFAEDKLIVAIYKSGTQQYFIDQGAGFTKAAEELGYKAQIINVEMDANLAISAVSDAIAAGAKAIAITAPDQAIGAAVAKAAADAGIPLIATDDPLKDGAGADVPFAGFDGVAMGTKVGDRAGELASAAGWLSDPNLGILTVGVPTLSVCVDRTSAEKARLIAAGAQEANFIDVDYDGTTDAALTAAGPVITAHPAVDKWVVVSCNDEGVLGASNALKNAGVAPADVIAVGLGAYEACRPWKEGIESGFKAALYISGVDVGDAAARALINAVEKGEPLPAKTVANTTIVDPATYTDIMPCP